MTYNKTTWKDRATEKSRTFTLQNNPDGTVTLIPVTGVVYEAGTPVNAVNMNKVETGIAAALPKDGSEAMTGDLLIGPINSSPNAASLPLRFYTRDGSGGLITGSYFYVQTNGDIMYHKNGASDQFVWHSGNDGAGSGLDADTVRGKTVLPLDGTSPMQGNGELFKMAGTDHVYMGFYPDGTGAGRKAYFGYPNGTTNDINLVNEISGGNITLVTTGGQLQINGFRVWDEARLRDNSGVFEFFTGGQWRAVGGIKNVQRGTANVPSGGATANVTISPVNMVKSVVTFPNMAGSNFSSYVKARLTSSTNLEVSGNLNFATDLSWEVAEHY